MAHAEMAQSAVEELLFFAGAKGLVEAEDIPFARNLLLDCMGLCKPSDPIELDYVPETATPILEKLLQAAIEAGLLEDTQSGRENFSARLMSCITPAPAIIRREFAKRYEHQSPQAATKWFYELCRNCDYIRVDQIQKNIRYFGDTPCGQLEITINLSKPEKDPREIAKLKNAPKTGYPKCMLCVENSGYAGRMDYPARQNHRIVPLTLGGKTWHLQYSPYLYYPEHCIALNEKHVPMALNRGAFQRLFDFVDQFPHYFIGSNADLPIVGGSILNHDHFQGGCHVFPMERSQVRCRLASPARDVEAYILNWPMTALVLSGKDREKLTDLADGLLSAWRVYSDEKRDILCSTTELHNTITPILRKEGEAYRLTLVLRNNRTTPAHPLGIFHPHAELHHIKKENIGLIEVMGLFILPGRLKEELESLSLYLTGQKPLVCPKDDDPACKHFPWLVKIANKVGTHLTHDRAVTVLREEIAMVCYQVLEDAGVYKQTEDGLLGVLQFLTSCGYEQI